MNCCTGSVWLYVYRGIHHTSKYSEADGAYQNWFLSDLYRIQQKKNFYLCIKSEAYGDTVESLFIFMEALLWLHTKHSYSKVVFINPNQKKITPTLPHKVYTNVKMILSCLQRKIYSIQSSSLQVLYHANIKSLIKGWRDWDIGYLTG